MTVHRHNTISDDAFYRYHHTHNLDSDSHDHDVSHTPDESEHTHADDEFDLSLWGHDPNKIALRLIRAFIDQLGGVETFRMMYKYYVMDWPYRQIAERWNLPVSTVRCKIQRAAQTMRKYEILPADWDLLDRTRQNAMSRSPLQTTETK